MSFKIRMQADDFFNAYRVLEKNYDPATLSIMGPGVVCLAFSLELHIKSLHFSLTGKALRGHNIFKLFEKLPPQTKQAIFAQKAISQNPFTMRGDIHSPQYFSRTYSSYDRFIDQMKAISDGFEKWRYSYENTMLKYDSFFALALIEAIKSVADNIQFQARKVF